jgi:hypothetical protein
MMLIVLHIVPLIGVASESSPSKTGPSIHLICNSTRLLLLLLLVRKVGYTFIADAVRRGLEHLFVGIAGKVLVLPRWSHALCLLQAGGNLLQQLFKPKSQRSHNPGKNVSITSKSVLVESSGVFVSHHQISAQIRHALAKGILL